MAERRSYRLVLLSTATSRMREFKINRWKILAFAILTLSIAVFIVTTASRFIAEHMTRVAMSEILEENNKLRQHITGISQRLETIDRSLSELALSDDRLRIVADLPRIDEDVRQVGIGGGTAPEIDYSEYDGSASQIIFDLDKIERELRLQRTSFSEIQRQLAEKKDLAFHTPSIRPVEGGFISSGFGNRKDPFTGRIAHHNGIDISVEQGTPIYASAKGRVVFAKRTPGLGLLIVLDHDYGFSTAYGHLNRILVNKGQTVERWQKIGEVGNTGRSTAPHLHYEVHVDESAVNPQDYIFNANEALQAAK